MRMFLAILVCKLGEAIPGKWQGSFPCPQGRAEALPVPSGSCSGRDGKSSWRWSATILRGQTH